MSTKKTPDKLWAGFAAVAGGLTIVDNLRKAMDGNDIEVRAFIRVHFTPVSKGR